MSPTCTEATILGTGVLPRCRSFVAVDWSGGRLDAHRRMWLAESTVLRSPRDGRSARTSRVVTRLENGRTRDELVDHLIELARREPRLVVGLDFAFSFPAWFLRARGLTSAREGWDLVAREGETWLAHCPFPFWGRPGARRPHYDDEHGAWRSTESETTRVRGIAPKTVFQVGGAGSVGTGSIRGMPYLTKLSAAGFSIWPFDPPRLPMVVEIYPRDLTGRVNKSSRIARALHVQRHLPRESRAIQDLAGASEDAFDAAISVARMRAHARDFTRLEPARTPIELLEGRIWRPRRDPLFENMLVRDVARAPRRAPERGRDERRA